nr:uncharacterized protein LOC105847042 isoform X1 [Hydra vulgaris]
MVVTLFLFHYSQHLAILIYWKLFQDIYSPWNEWSPCSRLCGPGKKYREQYCISSKCIHQMAKYDVQNCTSNCLDIQEKCDSTNAIVLLNNGETYNLIDNNPNVMQTVCNGNSLVYNSGTNPYTILSLRIRSRNKFTVSMRYQPVYGNNSWFKFPSQSNAKQALTLTTYATIGLMFLTKYDFNFSVEGIGYEIVCSTSSCFQGYLLGCFFSLPKVISFGNSFISRFLSDPTLPVIDTFNCTTMAAPFYYSTMYAVNRINSKTLSQNQSKRLYVKYSLKNNNLYYGIQGLTITTNFTSANDMASVFKKITYMGLAYYYGAFDCYGQVNTINGTKFGHFDRAHLEVLYTHDFNECQTNTGCSNYSICINLVRTFYCNCKLPYFGDGYNCNLKQYYFDTQLGVYSTLQFRQYTIPEFYFRGLFYANKTEELYVCGSYKKNRKYGCLSSKDIGQTWQYTHQRLDLIFGQSADGNVYGYSTLDSSYLMFHFSLKRWFSIPSTAYEKARSNIDFYSDKVVIPTLNVSVDPRRNEIILPLQQSIYRINNLILAVTLDGLSKCLNETEYLWVSYFQWQNLPFLD